MKRLIIYFILLTLTLSCAKDLGEFNPNEVSGKVLFSFRATNAEIVTRATSTSYEESLISNAYVILYRFPNGYNMTAGADPYDATNSVVQKWELSSDQIILDRNEHSFSTAVDLNFSTSSDTDETVYTLFAIVNYGDHNAIMNLSAEQIESISEVGISTWSDLKSLNVEMNENNLSIERGTNFLMKGIKPSLTKSDLISVAGQTGGDIIIDLKRVDAKFMFSLVYTSNVVPPGDSSPADADRPRKIISIRPDYWRVHNVPRKVNLATGTKEFVDSDIANSVAGDETFSSPVMNFEGIGQTAGSEFSFYLLPQKYTPVESIKELVADEYVNGGAPIAGFDNIDQYSFVYNDPDNPNKPTEFLRDTSGKRVEQSDGYVDFFMAPRIPVWQYKGMVLREKQTFDPTSTAEDLGRTNFTYAPKKSPYVEFFIEIEYDYFDEENGTTTRYVVDMKVILHLGMVKRTSDYPTADGVPLPFDLDSNNTTIDFDDYDITENTQYNYKLYWDGTNSIMAEATSGDPDTPTEEYTPGIEGAMFAPRIFKRLNSGNTQFIYSMPDALVNPTMGWAITSPFGQWTAYDLYNPNPVRNTDVRGDIENIDYRWVYFGVNPANASGYEKMRIYPGDEDKRPEKYYGSDISFIETKSVPFQGGGTINVPVYRNENTGEVVEVPVSDGVYYGTYAPNQNYWDFLAAFQADPTSTKLINIDHMMQIAYLNAAGYIAKNGSVPNDLDNTAGTTPSVWHTIGSPPLSYLTPVEGENFSLSTLNLTVFVDEYYYYENPLKHIRDGGGNQTVQDGLWSKFVNRAGKRVFSVVSPPQISKDYLSQYVATSAVFEQEPIQTYYNLANAGQEVTLAGSWSDNRQYSSTKYIVYGYEAFQDEKSYSPLSENGEANSGAGSAGVFPSTLNQSVNKYGVRSLRSGLRNTQLQWLRYFTNITAIHGDNEVLWSKYIDRENWVLAHDIAIYQCLKRNRDEDGDGYLDVSEIKWYAPAITQLGYQWIGAGALNTEGQLYFNNDYSQRHTALFSSTYVNSYDTGRGNSGGHMISWVNKGYTVSDAWEVVDSDPAGFIPGRHNFFTDAAWDALLASGKGGRRVHVRCYRNLGTPKDEEGKMLNLMLPQEHEFVKAIVRSGPYVPSDLGGELTGNVSVYRMDLVNIDPIAYRRYSQTEELPLHHLYEDHNKPWSSFEVIGDMSSETYDTNADFTETQLDQYFPKKTFWGHMNAVNNNITDSLPCPKGWRMPNQREASILQMMLIKRVSSTSSADYTSHNQNTDEGWGDITKLDRGGGYVSGPSIAEGDKYIMTRTYALMLKDSLAVPSAESITPLITLPQNGLTADGKFETYGVVVELGDITTINNVIGVNDFTRINLLNFGVITNDGYRGRVRCVRDVL